MLLNIYNRSWDDELLKALNVPRSVLPEVNSSSEVYGENTGRAYLEVSLNEPLSTRRAPSDPLIREYEPR